jgi:nicotinamide-nucleotide amidase
LSSALARAPRASQWFRGAVVAYSTQVKHDLLDVPPGPVISPTAVEAMARRALDLLGADLVVAVSGAGGPEPQEGNEPGTVWFGVCSESLLACEQRHFAGSPEQIVQQTIAHGLRLLLDALHRRLPSTVNPTSGFASSR